MNPPPEGGGVVTGGTGDTGLSHPCDGMGAPLNTGNWATGISQLAAGQDPTPIPMTANQLVVTVVSMVPSPLLSISIWAWPLGCAVILTKRLTPAAESTSLISSTPLSGGPPMPPCKDCTVLTERVAPVPVDDWMSRSFIVVKVLRSVTVLMVNLWLRVSGAAVPRIVVVVPSPVTFCVLMRLSGELTFTVDVLFSTVERLVPALVISVLRVVLRLQGATAKGVPVSASTELDRVPLSVWPNWTQLLNFVVTVSPTDRPAGSLSSRVMVMLPLPVSTLAGSGLLQKKVSVVTARSENAMSVRTLTLNASTVASFEVKFPEAFPSKRAAETNTSPAISSEISFISSLVAGVDALVVLVVDPPPQFASINPPSTTVAMAVIFFIVVTLVMLLLEMYSFHLRKTPPGKVETNT